MEEKILNIISDFNQNKNITLQELLEKYEVSYELFETYCYHKNLYSAFAKIKKVNANRLERHQITDIYRYLKDGDHSFGDIAHLLHISIDELWDKLETEKYTKYLGMGFDELCRHNDEILITREEMKLYFYFMKHQTCTFEDLEQVFHKKDYEIIDYFDQLLRHELSSKQIQQIFMLNKNRSLIKIKKEQKLDYQTELRNLVSLTDVELQYIEKQIQYFSTKNEKYISTKVLNDEKGTHYPSINYLEIKEIIRKLHCIILFINSDDSSIEPLLEKTGKTYDAFRETMNYSEFMQSFLPESIRLKFQLKLILFRKKKIVLPRDFKEQNGLKEALKNYLYYLDHQVVFSDMKDTNFTDFMNQKGFSQTYKTNLNQILQIPACLQQLENDRLIKKEYWKKVANINLLRSVLGTPKENIDLLYSKNEIFTVLDCMTQCEYDMQSTSEMLHISIEKLKQILLTEVANSCFSIYDTTFYQDIITVEFAKRIYFENNSYRKLASELGVNRTMLNESVLRLWSISPTLYAKVEEDKKIAAEVEIERMELIRDLYLRGYNQKQIAYLIDFPISTIQRQFKSYVNKLEDGKIKQKILLSLAHNQTHPEKRNHKKEEQ